MAYWTPYTVGYSWFEEDEMPVGAIALWSLLNGAIPTGWVECDGVANAPGPDLRNMFIVGRGAKTVDTSGGAATHVHADFLTHGTTVGAHVFTQPSGHSNHLVTQPSAHTDHAGPTHGSEPDSNTTGGTANAATTAHAALAHSAHSGSAVDAHSAHAGGAVDAHVVGNPSHTAHAATNHEPAWFALIYIQRMT